MTQALVLGRRRKGRPIETAVEEAAASLAAAGWTVSSSVVDRKKELRRETKRAVAAGVDVVVAVGGDGAVLQVVQKLAETKASLGIVPMGTGNLLATNLGIPKSVDAAVQVLLGQRPRVIDVGRVKVGGKDKVFAVACGVGFDAEVMKATAKSRKRRFGKLAYFASAFGQRRKVGNVRHEITVDGTTQTGGATQVFVANFGGMGFGFEPSLEVKPDDGVLDLIVVRAKGPVEGLLAGWEAIRQRRRGHSRGGRVFRTRAREVRVATKTRRLVEIDGSVIGTTPIEVSIRPAALSVLVPAGE
ncbi:MAG TPA: YegS/Rv2252/BmrU family lipid kinase [Patescibacteria group bacterium]|nr:YegS/Rv2252/BmrU family lipid kinase [Patescibacteria group bacterium]